jgi:hypothetical protein
MEADEKQYMWTPIIPDKEALGKFLNSVTTAKAECSISAQMITNEWGYKLIELLYIYGE